MQSSNRAKNFSYIAAAIGFAGWFGYGAGELKANSSFAKKEQIEQCTSSRSLSAAFRSSRTLLFLREVERLKVSLTASETEELRRSALASISAAADAFRWCEEKILSEELSGEDSWNFAYPTNWDSDHMTEALRKKISDQMMKNDAGLFSEWAVDQWFKTGKFDNETKP